jgi:hypothetical protein
MWFRLTWSRETAFMAEDPGPFRALGSVAAGEQRLSEQRPTNYPYRYKDFERLDMRGSPDPPRQYA